MLQKEQCQVEGKHHPVLITNPSGLELPYSYASQALLASPSMKSPLTCVSQKFILLPGAINSYFTPTHTFLLVMALGSPSLMTSRR